MKEIEVNNSIVISTSDNPMSCLHDYVRIQDREGMVNVKKEDIGKLIQELINISK